MVTARCCSYIGLMRHLRISPGGRLANQMIQFMIAKRLQKLVPDLAIHGYNMPLWRLSVTSPERLRIAGPELTGNLFDVRHVAGLMNAGWINSAHLTGFSLNMANFGSREECSELFRPATESGSGFGKDELVIHVRGEDILTGGHPDYGPLPVQFYARIVQQTGLRPVFLGQIQEGRYLDEIVRVFPGATIIPARDVLTDFQTMRKSKNIVLSLSSSGRVVFGCGPDPFARIRVPESAATARHRLPARGRCPLFVLSAAGSKMECGSGRSGGAVRRKPADRADRRRGRGPAVAARGMAHCVEAFGQARPAVRTSQADGG